MFLLMVAGNCIFESLRRSTMLFLNETILLPIMTAHFSAVLRQGLTESTVPYHTAWAMDGIPDLIPQKEATKRNCRNHRR